MAQTDSPKLDVGDRFPSFIVSMVDGTTLNIPDDLTADHTILIGFRGKW